MTSTYLIVYGAIAILLFSICIILRISKKDILHGGVKFGLINSLVLSVFWPINMILILTGWGYDVVQEWKKL